MRSLLVLVGQLLEPLLQMVLILSLVPLHHWVAVVEQTGQTRNLQ
jgi:hypothetical protein